MRRFLGHFSATPSVVLGILEATLVTVGCGAALYSGLSQPAGAATGSVGMAAVIASLGIILLMHTGGLYDRDAVLNLKRAIWRIAIVTAPIVGLSVLITGALANYTSAPIYPDHWRRILTLTAVWLISIISLRLLFRELHRTGYFTRRVLLLGSPCKAVELSNLATTPEQGFRIVAQFDPASREHSPDPSEIAARARQAEASEIVVAMGKDNRLLREAVFQYRLAGLRVTEYLDFFERESKRLCLDCLEEDWIAPPEDFRFGRIGDLARRIVDSVLAIAILIASAPVMLLTALAIKLEDGGPVLYRQERVGLRGQSFAVLKFRSMRCDAEADGVPAWASEHDCRVTAVGRLIRKVRIDELPQFLNVLGGTMAIIGPRPERPFFVRQFSRMIPFYDYRHAVKPGITGWAQVSFRYGASLEDTKRKLSYDLYYIKHRNFLFDLVILLKTIGVVVRGDGAR